VNVFLSTIPEKIVGDAPKELDPDSARLVAEAVDCRKPKIFSRCHFFGYYLYAALLRNYWRHSLNAMGLYNSQLVTVLIVNNPAEHKLKLVHEISELFLVDTQE